MEELSLDRTSGQAEETDPIGSCQGSRWGVAAAVIQDGADGGVQAAEIGRRRVQVAGREHVFIGYLPFLVTIF